MIEPVEVSDDLTGSTVVEAHCSFTGCPTMLRVAVASRTRLEIVADVILDACALLWRALEWVAIGLVLYGLFLYP
jgi:hypothetical protein